MGIGKNGVELKRVQRRTKKDDQRYKITSPYKEQMHQLRPF